MKRQHISAVALLACLVTLTTSCWGPVEGRVVRDPTEARGILSPKLIAMPDSSEVIYFRMEDYVVGLPAVWAVVRIRDYREGRFIDETNEMPGRRLQQPLVKTATCTARAAGADRDFGALGFDITRTTAYCNTEIIMSVRQQGPDLIVLLKRDGR